MAAGAGPRIVAAGPRLVSQATHRTDRVVDAVDLPRTLAGLAANGASLVSVGALEPEVRAKIARLAADAGRTLVAPMADGDVPGLDVIAPNGVRAGIPQLEAVSRWSIDGLLDAHEAAQAAPFLPYARHFQARGGRMGRRIARGVLDGLYPDRAAIDGEERMRRAAVLLAERRCLASSGAGAAGLVPGASLWAELERFERCATTADARAAQQAADLGDQQGQVRREPADALLRRDRALAAATGTPSACITGVAGGRIAPGRPADLLFADGVDADAAIAELRRHLSAVVIDGRHLDVEQLAARTDALVRRALQEAS